MIVVFVFQAKDGIRYLVRSRGLGDVYKRQEYVTSNSRVAGIAESLATYYMFFGDANLINNEIDRYLAVTREDIQAAAKKYLVKNNRVTLHYLPKSLESKS